jgi:hypothetical protein
MRDHLRRASLSENAGRDLNGAFSVGSVLKEQPVEGINLEKNTTANLTLYTQDQCLVPGRGTTQYRFPHKRFSSEALTLGNGTGPALVVGVFSAAHRPHSRTKVRQSWAIGRNNVFFLVAGHWTAELENEFNMHQDIIFVRSVEQYRYLTNKMVVFLCAVEKYIPGATVFKTDDDSYVRLSEIEKITRDRYRESLYLGHGLSIEKRKVVRNLDSAWYVSRETYQPDTYPIYAYGGGYLLTPSARHCALKQLQKRDHDIEVFPIEDAFVGILLDGCPDVDKEDDERFRTYSESKQRNLKPRHIRQNLVLHQVKYYEVMMTLHEEVCCNTETNLYEIDPVACSTLVCPEKFPRPSVLDPHSQRKKKKKTAEKRSEDHLHVRAKESFANR